MDINTLAKSIADQATGDKPVKAPHPEHTKRGLARAAKLEPERRREIAKIAAEARWTKE